jgi:hypothetical protein
LFKDEHNLDFFYSFSWKFGALADNLNIPQFDGITGTFKQAQVYFNPYGKSPTRAETVQNGLLFIAINSNVHRAVKMLLEGSEKKRFFEVHL